MCRKLCMWLLSTQEANCNITLLSFPNPHFPTLLCEARTGTPRAEFQGAPLGSAKRGGGRRLEGWRRKNAKRCPARVTALLPVFYPNVQNQPPGGPSSESEPQSQSTETPSKLLFPGDLTPSPSYPSSRCHSCSLRCYCLGVTLVPSFALSFLQLLVSQFSMVIFSVEATSTVSVFPPGPSQILNKIYKSMWLKTHEQYARWKRCFGVATSWVLCIFLQIFLKTWHDSVSQL